MDWPAGFSRLFSPCYMAVIVFAHDYRALNI